MGNATNCHACDCACDVINKDCGKALPATSAWDEELAHARPKLPAASTVILPNSAYQEQHQKHQRQQHSGADAAGGSANTFATITCGETGATDAAAPLPLPPESDSEAPWRVDPHAADQAEAGAEQQNPVTLHFTLEGNRPIGMHCAKLVVPEPGGTLVVSALAATCVFATTTSGEPGIRAGDVIAGVNGEFSDSGRMLDALHQIRRTGGDVTLTVLGRPGRFYVRLTRREQEALGIMVVIREDNIDVIEVQEVLEDGAIPRWNEVNVQRRVVSGDSIVAINGIVASAQAMIQRLKTAWQNGDEGIEICIETAPRDMPVS